MELVKNIFFNTDKLIEGTNVKISYTGRLFGGKLRVCFSSLWFWSTMGTM